MSEPKTYLPAAISEVGPFAEIAAQSGMFGSSSPPELIVKLMAGAAWGVPPMASLSDIHVVKGKPMASGTLLRAMIRQSGTYDYRIVEHTDERAVIEFLRVLPSGDREILGTTDFDIQRAQRQGLTSNRLYKTAPRNMLLARATSDGVKTHCPDVFVGSIYAEGELEDDREPVQFPPQRAEPRRNPRTGSMVGQPTQVPPNPAQVLGEVMDAEFSETAVDVSEAPAGDQRTPPRNLLEFAQQGGTLGSDPTPSPTPPASPGGSSLIQVEVPGVGAIQIRPAPEGMDGPKWANGARYAFQHYAALDDDQAKTLRELAKTVTTGMGWQTLYEKHGKPTRAGGAA